jgi:hypothetical protein
MSTKTSGLGSVIIIDDSAGTPRTISNDITNYSFSTPRGVQDVTGVDKSANERILLLADFSVTLNGVMNWATANMSHDVFKTVPSTSVNRTTSINPVGTTSTFPKLNNEVLYTDYQITRNNTGELIWQAPGALADGTVPAWSTN